MTYTQAEINAYRAFMLTNGGVTRMTIADKSYDFEPLEKMRAQLAYMERNLAGTTTPHTRYAATSKGV